MTENSIIIVDSLRKISYVFLGILAILQFCSFISTVIRMWRFANIFPGKISISEKKDEEGNILQVSINPDKERNRYYAKIATFINEYIIYANIRKLSEAKRITKEYLEGKEDSINRSLYTPLYLGLMGTILGIIFGLSEYIAITEYCRNNPELGFCIFDVVKKGAVAVKSKEPLDYIIEAVIAAMTVSVLGLILAVINSTRNFSRMKSKLEVGEETFYRNLMDCELSDGNKLFSESEDDLAENLRKFNDKLEINIENMNETMAGATESIESGMNLAIISAQAAKDTAEAINSIKLKNLEHIFKGMRQYTENIEKLDGKLKQVQDYMDSMSDFLRRIHVFEDALKTQQTLSKVMDNLDKHSHSLNILLEGMNTRSEIFFDMQKNLNENFEILESYRKVSQNAGEEVNQGFKQLENSFKTLKEDLEEKWRKINQDVDGVINTSVREMINGFDSLGEHIDGFSKTMETKIDGQINIITKGFSDAFKPILEHVKQLKEGISATESEDWAEKRLQDIKVDTEKIIGLQFSEITNAMNNWSSSLIENIQNVWSKDLVKKIENSAIRNESSKTDKIGESIDSLAKVMANHQKVLIEIYENTRPRSFLTEIKDFFGIKRKRNFDQFN